MPAARDPSRRSLRALAALLAVGLAAAAAFAPTAGARVGDGSRPGVVRYEPPYRKVLSGGDRFNHVEADRSSGDITILRAFPFPGSFGCDPESLAGWASFRLTHAVERPVRSVAVSFADGMLEPHAFISVVVVDGAGRWLGARSVQGPDVAADGRVRVPLGGRSPDRGGRVVVTFGLQLSSACPQAGGAHVSFPAVAVRTR